MLACLPASGDPTTRFLSRTQMNTGLQKWETTQKMRSANYPTPAELDAYAKKVANNPLTIQIFPNSIKVPQRKHIRRTVNGLDTSSSSQRLSPYPSQVSARAGLLAVLRVPAKGTIKESDGSRARQLHKAIIMNPHSGAYATQSTLNLSQPGPHLQGHSQPQPQPQAQALVALKQGLVHSQAMNQQQGEAHPMTLQQAQTMPNPHALQQRNMAHSQALQRQHSLSQLQNSLQQQSLAHPQGLQRQQSLPHTHTLQQQSQPRPSVGPAPQQQQQLSHLQALQRHTVPHQQALLQQQGVTQDLRHISDGARVQSLQHSQGLVGSQPLPQTPGLGPSAAPNGLQQQPLPNTYGPRKPPDADAPPNITVSTSTIPLSMAATLHQNRPSDLSSIVHQINQFCQARAGMGSTSVCEGQIANPSPISRNLLINASSRVSTHNPAMGSGPSCLMVGPTDKPTPQASAAAAALHPQPNMAAMNSMPNFHPDTEKLQLQQQLHRQIQQQQQLQQQQQQLQQQQQQQQQHQQAQQLQQQQRSWAQHQLTHMQQPPEGAHPCKNPRREPPTGPGFPSRNLSYPHKLPSAAQSFPLKHPTEKPRPSSPVKGPAGSMPYTNGNFMQPQWNSIPSTASNNGSGLQELPMPFREAQPGASTDYNPGSNYRAEKGAPAGQSKLVPNMDFLGRDFQIPSFHEQNLEVIDRMQRPPMGQGQEPSNGRGVHAHHPGYN